MQHSIFLWIVNGLQFFRKRTGTIGPAFLMWVVIASCVYDYPIPNIADRDQLLVVDGFYDNATSQAQIKISRTLAIQSTENPVGLTGATVGIESEFGVFELNEAGGGVYSGFVFIATGNKCRLNITLPNQKKYQSDWTEVLGTPPVDSVTFSTSNLGFQIEVSTHDEEKNNAYYLWQYDETWEYTSAFASDYIIENGALSYRNDDIYHCWQTRPSTSILTYSTKSLDQNIVSKFPVTTIPKGSEKLALKYSILVRQFCVDKQAYEYWNTLKKNTESLGGLFDPQPSQLNGNIHAVDNPNERVVGYFQTASSTQMRKTVSLNELPREFQIPRDFSECTKDIIHVSLINTLDQRFYLVVSSVPGQGPVPTEYYYAPIRCADCRVQGGTTNRPDYW